MLLNKKDFEILKNGCDRDVDKKVLNWFERERARYSSKPVQGNDGKFRIFKDGVWIEQPTYE
jgi:hypothetical protein